MNNTIFMKSMWKGILMFLLYLIIYFTSNALPLAQCCCAFAVILSSLWAMAEKEDGLTWIAEWAGILIIGTMVLAAIGNEWLVYLGFQPENLASIRAKAPFYVFLALTFYLWGCMAWKAVTTVKFLFKPKRQDIEEDDDSLENLISSIVLIVLIISFQHIV